MSLIERAAAMAAASRRRDPPAPPPRGTVPPAAAEAGRPARREPAPTPVAAPAPAPAPAPARRFALDLAALGRRGHLVPGNLRGPLAREVNAVKRGLHRILGDRQERQLVLMVTSTKAGEGKSFVSLNLALSFLLVDARRVLLVDADDVRGGLSRELGLPEGPGLAEEMRTGELRLDERLLGAERHRLEVLPAGSLSATGAEWTRHDGQRLVLALRRLAAARDAVVVIDTPPLAACPTAHLLADHVDHVLFVVGAGRTRTDEIAHALAQLADHRATSFVLNRATAPATPAEYGYGPAAGGPRA